MTEPTTYGRCLVGAATDTPCPRPAVYLDGEDGPRFCERHLAAVRVQHVVSEVQGLLSHHVQEVNDWADSYK